MYDAQNRRTAESASGGNHGTVTYAYDPSSRRQTLQPSGLQSVTYGYDANSRLTGLTQGTQSAALTYDAENRRTTLTLPNGIVLSYSYDAASRLIGQTYTGPSAALGDLTYSYDATGNRLTTGGSFARSGLPTAISASAYDAANQQLTFGSVAQTFDANGNLLTQTDATGTTTYTWDARNRLTALTGPTVNATFVYDALGRRTAKTIDGQSTSVLYDGLDIVKEEGGTGDASYLRTLGIDEALSRTNANGTLTYLSDALGSTLALADSSGGLPTTYTYAPFGETSVSGLPSASPVQFTGRENDGTGLYYYRARYYDPIRSRFVSEDPLGLAAGALNLYSYAGNAPIRFRDALGLWTPAAHRELTRDVARALGLPGADLVARSSGREDYRARAEGDWDAKEHAMPGSAWREHAENMLNEALRQAALGNNAEAMKALGRGVHTIQDARAHDLRDPQGGFLEHLLGNPDDPDQNPYEWQRAREATEDYLKRYMHGAQPPCM